MTPNSALDTACAELSALALRIGAGGIEVQVRADGRVVVRLLAAAGWSQAAARADIVPGSKLPTPSEALASLVRT